MGLDQYAFAVSKEAIGDQQVDFKIPDDVTETQIHYWRKHPNMQGWMEKLYTDKGGRSRDFNCDNVNLTLEDLDRLEKDIRFNDLPETEGFFFGTSDGSETEDDLEFVRKAKECLKNGLAVYYTSWW